MPPDLCLLALVVLVGELAPLRVPSPLAEGVQVLQSAIKKSTMILIYKSVNSNKDAN